MVATGHADGTVRLWSVREPQAGTRLEAGPHAVSRLPVRCHMQPVWELYEVRSLRLERPEDAATTAAAAAGAAAVTALEVGRGYEKMLWSASVDGRLRAWQAPSGRAPDASAQP